MKKDTVAGALEDLFARLRNSTLTKLLFVGFLILVLQIPIAFISSLVRERQYTRDEAVRSVTSVWGERQTIAGPVLVVPFHDRSRHLTDDRRHAFFLPERVDWQSDVATEVRRRGIFTVPLFIAKAKASAVFAVPDFSAWQVAPADVIWEGAELVIGISDPKALREPVAARVGGRSIPFGPGRGAADFLSAGIRAPVGTAAKGLSTIDFALTFGGSENLSFQPFGARTTVKMTSPWPDPSFNGAYLPTTRAVAAKGFEAEWNVLDLGRNYPQRWLSGEIKEDALHGSAFGVSLLAPISAYSLTERTTKYQLLFLGLTFLVFTVFELFQRLRLHSVQYLLVGFTLCLFFLLCLSLAEHFGFTAAYVAAATAVVGLVGIYGRAILRDRSRALAVCGLLAGLYAFLYVLLHLEDYALLVGTLGLFGALTAIMIATRHVDWHRLGEPSESTG